MGVISYPDLTFDEVKFSGQTDWQYDHPSGYKDSTAIGDFRDGHPYLLYLGASGGYAKFSCTIKDDGSYLAKYQKIPSGDVEEFTVVKKDNYDRVQLSFETGQIQVEPEIGTYDLLFTKYTHIFEDGSPYLLTGTLTNDYVLTDTVTESDFSSITLEDLENADYKTDHDLIGYDWKEYMFDTGSYVVQPQKVYLIKSTEGVYYKLHFTDFYDQNGLKGAPKFEFQQL